MPKQNLHLPLLTSSPATTTSTIYFQIEHRETDEKSKLNDFLYYAMNGKSLRKIFSENKEKGN